MPTLWNDLRAEDFDARITPSLFDLPTAYRREHQQRALAEPGSLFAIGEQLQADNAALHWYVVACSGPKLDQPAPAYLLYTGSTFRHSFAAADAAATATGGRVLILSAAHGLVDPERELAPYDVKLTSIAAKGIGTVGRQLAEYGVKPGDVVHSMLPKAYAELLQGAMLTRPGTFAGVQLVDEYAGARGVGDHRAANWRIMQAANNA